MTTFEELKPIHGFIALTIIYCLWMITLYIFFRPRDEHSLRSVAILVLGDIGRSPRMMYHAQSFLQNNFQMDLIGYGDSKPIPALEGLPLRILPQLPSMFTLLPFTLLAPIKILHQILSILFVLLVQIPRAPEFILVQNPPSIPSLVIVAFVAKIRGSKVIIDWHNLGYSILALKLGNEHRFVKIAKWIEATFGRTAYAHLFVTQAMRDRLVEDWGLQGQKIVLHDRPPRHFHRLLPQEVHDLFVKSTSIWRHPKTLQGWLPNSSVPYSTPFTETIRSQDEPNDLPSGRITSISFQAIVSSPLPFGGLTPTPVRIHAPRLRADRPALVVSSTSWTPDEDFGLLKDALLLYEERAKAGNGSLPKMLMMVTGKGPMRADYMKEMDKLQEEWQWVRCVSVWLEAADYPHLLGSCDLGVSLHSSSSGLDLPMKVVDMFGCGLPVCALHFKCLGELLKANVNGLVFNDAEELADQFEMLLKGFPDTPKLALMRDELTKHRHDGELHGHDEEWSSWDEHWDKVMRPLLLRDVHSI